MSTVEPTTSKAQASAREDHGLSEAELLHCYATMVRVRAFDDVCLKLQRSGRIGFSIPNKGVEAWPDILAGIERARQDHDSLGVTCSFGDWQRDVNGIARANALAADLPPPSSNDSMFPPRRPSRPTARLWSGWSGRVG